jgi:nucleoside-diphosphate-sugar epimerase
VRVLVLGGTRFIGPYVVRLLAEQGHDVTIFHRGETEADLPPSVRHVHGNFANFSEHLGRLRADEPEVVLDMVPFIDKGGHGVLYFRGVAKRAVVITSCDVYRAFARVWRSEPGPPDPIPLSEESPLRTTPVRELAPPIDYDNVEIERSVGGDHRLPVTVVRPTAIHGSGDPQHRLYPWLKRMDDGRPAILLDEALLSWRRAHCYVEDVAHAIALAIGDEAAAGRTYNVSYERTLTEIEWVEEIARVAGWQGEVVLAKSELLPESLREDAFDLRQDYVIDSSRIRRELGYREIANEDEALRRTIEWERLHRPEPRSAPEPDYEAEDRTLAALGRGGKRRTRSWLSTPTAVTTPRCK